MVPVPSPSSSASCEFAVARPGVRQTGLTAVAFTAVAGAAPLGIEAPRAPTWPSGATALCASSTLSLPFAEAPSAKNNRKIKASEAVFLKTHYVRRNVKSKLQPQGPSVPQKQAG